MPSLFPLKLFYFVAKNFYYFLFILPLFLVQISSNMNIFFISPFLLHER